MFSVGLLYSTHDFLELVLKVGITISDFKTHFYSYKYTTPDKILEVSFKCGWLKISKDGDILLSNRGKEIATENYKLALMYQLEDLIFNFNPSWGSLLLKGRANAKYYLPLDVAQCFKECGLFDELNEEIIKYWDNIATAYRNYTNKKMIDIGRYGEKLSYHHEWERTGIKPLWQAVESNLAGYDILSVVDSNSKDPLQIEVKSTTCDINYSKIHITRNEWETAENSRNYIFHLWHIAESETLYKIDSSLISEHIPSNNGVGMWENTEIPFKKLINSR